MTPEEQRKLEEDQIKSSFSELQQELSGLQNEISDENETETFSELTKQLNGLQEQINQISENTDLGTLRKELAEIRQDFDEFKQSIRGEASDLQEQIRESVDKQNEKIPTPSTYEMLRDSETYNRLLMIISYNSNEFKDLPGDTPEAKLEHIFTKIRTSIVLFMKNKLGDSENTEKIIDNTIAPALEWSLMELLRDNGNETNIGMLQGIDNISWGSLGRLVRGVGRFATKSTGSYSKFSQWMNAIDYLSVHNGVLSNPTKSNVLTNPLKFKAYINNEEFAKEGFSPYTLISGNIFEVSSDDNFEFGISTQEKQNILSEIGNIQVANSPTTTSLIAKMIDKPEQFLLKTQGLQDTANHVLDSVNSLNGGAKLVGVDILGEISKAPEQRKTLYKILDFVCKLIGITGGLEGIVKKWRLERMNLTDAKNDNINHIFKEYKELAGDNMQLSITDENSCKAALNDFAVTNPQNTSTTKGDFLRDSIAEKVDVSLISPGVIQVAIERKFLGNSLDYYLKKETIKEKNGRTKEKKVVDESKFTENDKLALAHVHLVNMKSHLESYNQNNLSDFYTNIGSTEDIALCITASLYADKNDVIEGVKAKVFLPENYGLVRLDGSIDDSGTERDQPSGEVSQYKLSPGEYPFKDVPPYKGIAAYDLRNVKITPALDYSELSKKHDEGLFKLTGTNITNKGSEYPTNTTTGNKNNNPCDISHSSSDIGYVSSSTVADGQRLAKFNRPVDGIASAMRLLKNKYQNKSVTEIDVGGYQGYYKANEEIGLSALRIKWITDQCNALGIGPHQMLDFNDPTTLKSFVAQVAVLETGTHIGQKLLDDAYNLAFA